MGSDKRKVQGYLEAEVAQQFDDFKAEQGIGSDSAALALILREYFGLVGEAAPGALDGGELNKRIQTVVEQELNQFAVRMGDRLNNIQSETKNQLRQLELTVNRIAESNRESFVEVHRKLSNLESETEALHDTVEVLLNESPIPQSESPDITLEGYNAENSLGESGDRQTSTTPESDSPAIQGLPVCPKGCESEFYTTTMTRHTSSTGVDEYWCAECKSVFDASLSEVQRLDDSPVDSSSTHTLTRAELAKRLGVRPETIWKNRNKSNFAEWCKEKDPDGHAWVFCADVNAYVMSPESV